MGPTPEIAARSAQSLRLRSAISASVRSWNTTYAGTPSAWARPRRHPFSRSNSAPPRPTVSDAPAARRPARRRRRRELQLLEERARPRAAVARPREEQVPARARDPDVEQPAFLVRVGVGAARPVRELAVQQPGQEHGVELQALRSMVGHQVHAPSLCSVAKRWASSSTKAATVGAGVSALVLGRERAQAGEVGLTRGLLLGVGRRLGVVAELVGDARTASASVAALAASSRASTARGPGRRRNAPSRTWYGMPGGGERLLVRLRSCVDPVQHRDLVPAPRPRREGGARPPTTTRPRPSASGAARAIGGARRVRRVQRLAEPAQAGAERGSPARAPRATSGSSPRGARPSLREAAREPEQVLGRRAREGVDRLVVVAHHAELVALAQPALEQRRCSGFTSWYSSTVNAGKRARTASAASGCSSNSRTASPSMSSKSSRPVALLAALVPVEDRGASARPGSAARGRRARARYASGGIIRFFAHSISPASSRRGRNLCGGGKRVRERGDQRSLVVEHLGKRLARVRGPQPRELRQRRRVERARLHALDAERREPLLQLARGLLGERDREDLRAANAPLATWHAMRCVIVVVLPVPAPARIATGPRTRGPPPAGPRSALRERSRGRPTSRTLASRQSNSSRA